MGVRELAKLREKQAKWAIREMICIHGKEGGMSFNDMFKMMRGGKWAYTIKSRNTLSNYLKELLEAGDVKRNIRTRKYEITEKGKKMVERFRIVDQILSSPDMMMFADWAYWTGKPFDTVSSVIFFIDREEEFSPNAIRIPSKQLEGFGWEPTIKECAKDLGLDYESQREEVWEALFKGINRIILVETLTPSLLLEKLQGKGKLFLRQKQGVI